MSEILEQENAVVLAAAEKMVSLGQTISERIVNGKQSKAEYEQANNILRLLTAYKDNSFTDDDLESVLYCLKDLSEASLFPTVNPIVGQELVYLVDSESGGSGSMIVQNSGSSLTVRDTINFYNGLFASDDGSRINVGIGGNLSINATIGLGSKNLTIDASGAGSFIFTFGSDADGDLYQRLGGKLVRIPKGNDGEVLSMDSGAITWTTSSLGFTPINKAGDTGISGTLTFDTGFGIDNAGVLPIGASATNVNIGGTELTIKDKLITLNQGGAAASGGGSGFEINENSSITPKLFIISELHQYSILSYR